MTKKGGIQPHEHVPTLLTRAKVEGFTFAGYPEADIAKYLEISIKTLRKHYPQELHHSRMDKITLVGKKAFTRAMKGNDKMIELILRTQARWSNPQPAPPVIQVNLTELEKHVERTIGSTGNIEADTDGDSE